MNIKRYLLFALAMLVIDWALGDRHVARVIPLWSLLVFNFPFGFPLVWLESHWAGTHYQVGDQSIGETWSFVSLCFSVLAQAWLYSLLLGCRQNRKHATRAGQPEHSSYPPPCLPTRWGGGRWVSTTIGS